MPVPEGSGQLVCGQELGPAGNQGGCHRSVSSAGCGWVSPSLCPCLRLLIRPLEGGTASSVDVKGRGWQEPLAA